MSCTKITHRRRIIEKCLKTFHVENKFYPLRLVMCPMNNCYICGEKHKYTKSMYIKNYLRLKEILKSTNNLTKNINNLDLVGDFKQVLSDTLKNKLIFPPVIFKFASRIISVDAYVG